MPSIFLLWLTEWERATARTCPVCTGLNKMKGLAPLGCRPLFLLFFPFFALLSAQVSDHCDWKILKVSALGPLLYKNPVESGIGGGGGRILSQCPRASLYKGTVEYVREYVYVVKPLGHFYYKTLYYIKALYYKKTLDYIKTLHYISTLC